MSYRGRGGAPTSAPRNPEDTWNDPQIGRIRRSANIGPPAVRTVPLRFQTGVQPARGRGRGGAARGGGRGGAVSQADAERNAYYENRGESSYSSQTYVPAPSAPRARAPAPPHRLPPRPEPPRVNQTRGRTSRSPSPNRHRRRYSPPPASREWSHDAAPRVRERTPSPRRNRPPMNGTAGPSRASRASSSRSAGEPSRRPSKPPSLPTPLSQLPPPPTTQPQPQQSQPAPLKFTLNNYNRRPDEPKPAVDGPSKGKAPQQSEERRALQREPSVDSESSDEEPLRRKVARPPPHPSLDPIDGILAGHIPPKASSSKKAEKASASPKSKKAAAKPKAPKVPKPTKPSSKKAKLFSNGPDVKPNILDFEQDQLIDEKDDFREPTPEPPRLQLEGVHAVKRTDLPTNLYGGDAETRRKNRNAYRSRLRAQLRMEGKRDVGIHWRDDGCAVDWKRIEPGQLSSDIEIIDPPTSSRAPAVPSTPNGDGSSSDSDIEFIDPPKAPAPATPVEVVDVASAPPTAPRAPKWTTLDVTPEASSSTQPTPDPTPLPTLKVSLKNHRQPAATSAPPRLPSPLPPAKSAPTPPPPAQPSQPLTQRPASLPTPAPTPATSAPPAPPKLPPKSVPFVAPLVSNADVVNDVFITKLFLPLKYRTDDDRERPNYTRWLKDRATPYQGLGDDGQPIQLTFAYVESDGIEIYRKGDGPGPPPKSKSTGAAGPSGSSGPNLPPKPSTSSVKPPPPNTAVKSSTSATKAPAASSGPSKSTAAAKGKKPSAEDEEMAFMNRAGSSSAAKSTPAAKPKKEDDEEMMFLNRSASNTRPHPSAIKSAGSGPACTFFREGRCSFGDACWFYHPDPGANGATRAVTTQSQSAETSSSVPRPVKRSRAEGSPPEVKESKKTKPTPVVPVGTAKPKPALVPEAVTGISQAKAAKRPAIADPPADVAKPRQNMSLARGTSRAAPDSSSFAKPSPAPLPQPVVRSAPAHTAGRPTPSSSTTSTPTPASGSTAAAVAPASASTTPGRSLEEITRELESKMTAITKWTQMLDAFPAQASTLQLQVLRTEKEIFALNQEREDAIKAEAAQ